MLNRFEYANDIPPLVRDRLVDREPLCTDAVFEASSLIWTRETDTKGRSLYVLTKRGLVDFRLGVFSEDEILKMPDEDFKNRVFIQDVEDQRRREAAYVQERIDDWRIRLEQLFSQVATWVPSSWTVLEGHVIQRDEELMCRYSIKPGQLPTFTLLKNKHRVALVPSALWIIGADGRVNVTVDATQYILVDRRDNPGLPARWEIVLGEQRKRTVPFTRDIFLSILGELS